MNEDDFEGTLVLEKLSAMGKVDDFFEAVDSDDFKLAATLMRTAGVDSQSIARVLKQMADGES